VLCYLLFYASSRLRSSLREELSFELESLLKLAFLIFSILACELFKVLLRLVFDAICLVFSKLELRFSKPG